MYTFCSPYMQNNHWPKMTRGKRIFKSKVKGVHFSLFVKWSKVARITIQRTVCVSLMQLTTTGGFTKKERIPHSHGQENVSDGHVYYKRPRAKQVWTPTQSKTAFLRSRATADRPWRGNQGRITDPLVGRYMSGSLCNISLWTRAEHRKRPRSHALLHRPCISAHEYTTATLGDRQLSKHHTHAHAHTQTHAHTQVK